MAKRRKKQTRKKPKKRLIKSSIKKKSKHNKSSSQKRAMSFKLIRTPLILLLVFYSGIIIGNVVSLNHIPLAHTCVSAFDTPPQIPGKGELGLVDTHPVSKDEKQQSSELAMLKTLLFSLCNHIIHSPEFDDAAIDRQMATQYLLHLEALETNAHDPALYQRVGTDLTKIFAAKQRK